MLIATGFGYVLLMIDNFVHDNSLLIKPQLRRWQLTESYSLAQYGLWFGKYSIA